MNAQLDMTHVPLHRLTLSPRNARKTAGADINGLAASINARGLLQNLTVVAKCDGVGDDQFEVVAGGRRLAALQQLQREGRMAPDAAIPVRIIADDDDALEASTAENTLREAMHPADQFDAFKGMVDAGKSISDVAAHFGLAEIVVKQRLKLANVAPDLLQVYRDDGMQLDQLQALALTDDHEAQRQAWSVKDHWERQAHAIRTRLTRTEVSARNAAARFIGVDAYLAAGGTVRRDLFGKDDNDTWLQDPALVDRLVLDKLEAVAQAERDAGWSWVETHLSIDYAQEAEYGQAQQPEGEPQYATPEDAARAAAIESRLAELEAIDVDELDSRDEEEKLLAEEEDLREELSDIEGRCVLPWPEEIKNVTGVLVVMRNSGCYIERGRSRPGQKLDKQSGAITGQAKPAKSDAKPKKPELSAAVLQTLSAHRSEVARHHVARDPQLALALLVDWYVARMKHDFSDAHVLNLQVTTVPDARKAAPDIHKALDDETGVHAACFKKIPRKEQRLAWLIQQPQADLLQMLAYCVGNRFGALSESPAGHPGISALHDAIGFNMADHWNPGCDQFLERIPRALVEVAVEEACRRKGMIDSKGCAANVLTNKGKTAIAAAAAKFMAGSGWLPKPLRGPGYEKPAVKAKSPNKKAKAPAKKTAVKKRNT